MRNQPLIDTIQALKKASKESGKAIWKALAEELDKPKRRRVAVNLSRIDRYAEEDEVVALAQPLAIALRDQVDGLSTR